MNRRIKKSLAMLLVTGTLLTSNATVFADEQAAPVSTAPVETSLSAVETSLSAVAVHYGIIIGDNVRLRRTYGTNGTIIRTLSYGTTISNVDEMSVEYYADGYYWKRIRLADGTVGYVATDFVSFSN